MIRESIENGTTVFHEMFGLGIFLGYETKEGYYKGFAIVTFNEFPGQSLIHRKKLIEIEGKEGGENNERK